MSWYVRQIFSQAVQSKGLGGYLENIGITPDIIEYILLLDKQTAQLLTNEIRKNPSLTLQQLQSIQMSKQGVEKKDPYLNREKQIASNFELELPQFSKWILVNFRKLRRGLMWTDNMGRSIIPYGTESPLTSQEMNMYDNFSSSIVEIKDWYISVRPDIFSYTAQEAAIASQDWHKMMAGQGEGKMYEPTKPDLIVYGPEWKNEEYNGWTIQRVESENDLLVEGNKMDHCVGGFCDNVANEYSNIYSLRDPQNNPHITLEIGGGRDNYPGTMKQIQGKSNSEPKNEYKAMIKEWISTNGEQVGIQKEINTFENMEEEYGAYDSPSVGEITEAIRSIIQGEENEYGLKYIFDSDLTTVIDKIVTTGEAEASGYYSRNNGYVGDITDSAPYITNLALMLDLKLPHFPRHSAEYKELLVNNPKNTNWKNIEEVENWAWKTRDEIQENFIDYETGLDYPQEENYENPEEYEKAMIEHDSAEAEIHEKWMGQSITGGFATDLLNEIKDYSKSGIIPSAQERYEKKKLKGYNMNWFKQAQQYTPITIVSYIPSYEELGISFNGGKKYVYPNVTPFIHNEIKRLLKYKNYNKVQKILKNLSANNPKNQEEDKDAIMNELFGGEKEDRGLFDELV